MFLSKSVNFGHVNSLCAQFKRRIVDRKHRCEQMQNQQENQSKRRKDGCFKFLREKDDYSVEKLFPVIQKALPDFVVIDCNL